ncbi:MAG: hypothetical protein IT423_14930 [Pirellulaceae bacterium]|nr:hypothetical protein [Pirellulaceae bacterium]
MKKSFVMLVVVGLVSSLSMPAFAIKQLNDKFVEIYASADSKDASDEFKTLVKDAKCNVCHIQGENKKKRNPFGESLHKAIEEAKFDVKAFGKEPAKYADEVKAMFKKVTEQKAGATDKTFAARMKAGELPGGDKEGKGLAK